MTFKEFADKINRMPAEAQNLKVTIPVKGELFEIDSVIVTNAAYWEAAGDGVDAEKRNMVFKKTIIIS